MKKIQKQALNTEGFTLVELLATIAILGIATLGIAGLFYSIQYTQRQAGYLDTATRAAQREIESLRNNSYNNLQDGQTITFTSELPASLPKNKTGTVVVSEPWAGLKRVDVSVVYTDAGQRHEVKMSSYIGVIGLSQ